jgi:hypothetical protein
MIYTDLANVTAGFYKGYMDATGNDPSSTSLAIVLATTSSIEGIIKFLSVKEDNKNKLRKTIRKTIDSKYKQKSPVVEGIKCGLIGAPIFGALEIALGYGAGFAIHKVIS